MIRKIMILIMMIMLNIMFNSFKLFLIELLLEISRPVNSF